DGAGLEAFAEPVVSPRMTDDSEVHRPLRGGRAHQVVADSGGRPAGGGRVRGGGGGAAGGWAGGGGGGGGGRGSAGGWAGGRAAGAGGGRGDGGRKAAKALVTTSERAANSYKVAGRPPPAVGGAVPAVGRITLRRVRIRCRFVAETR